MLPTQPMALPSTDAYKKLATLTCLKVEPAFAQVATRALLDFGIIPGNTDEPGLGSRLLPFRIKLRRKAPSDELISQKGKHHPL